MWDSPDHCGYWTVRELLHRVGGTVLPADTFSQHRAKAGRTPLSSDTKLSGEPHLSSWISTLPADSTLNCLLYNSPEYEASFPRMEGTLFLSVEGKQIIFWNFFVCLCVCISVSVAFISSRQAHAFNVFRISSRPGAQ